MMIEASVSYKSGSPLKVSHFLLLSDLAVTVLVMIEGAIQRMTTEASVSCKSGSHLKVGHFPLLSDSAVTV
jgi:hypothetical protein